MTTTGNAFIDLIIVTATVATSITAVTKLIGPLLKILGSVHIFLHGVGSIKEIKDTIAGNQHLLEKIHAQVLPVGQPTNVESLNILRNEIYVVRQSRLKDQSLAGTKSFVADKKGLMIWVSEPWLQWVGCDLEDAVKNGWINAVCEDEREEVYREFLRAVEHERRIDILCNYCINGESYPVHMSAWPVRNADREISHYEGRVNDTKKDVIQ